MIKSIVEYLLNEYNVDVGIKGIVVLHVISWRTKSNCQCNSGEKLTNPERQK